MSILAENLEFVKKTNPQLHDVIYQKIHGADHITSTEALLCRNLSGGLNIKIKKDDRESFIHSNYNAEQESKRWVQSVNLDADIIVIVGLGLGYHLKELLRQVDKKKQIYIVEPDIPVFRLFFENILIKDVFNERVTLILSNDPDYAGQIIFEGFKRRVLGSIEFAIYTGYKNYYLDFFNSIEERFSDFIKTLHVNINTSEYFKHLWQLNCLMNISNINGAYNGRFLKDKFNGIPAVIVSAGPSLNKNIGQLKSICDNCIMLAGGSSVTILQKNGIKPHFAVAIDGSPLVKDIYEGYDCKDIALIYINRLYYEIVQNYKDKRIVFIDVIDELSEFFAEHMGMSFHAIEPDQTVAGINVVLACYLGCNPIVLVGQDFAVTNLEIHADGAAHMHNFSEDIDNGSGKLIKMNDIYGNETYTYKGLLSGKLSMERRVMTAINKGHRFINATEGGIGVNGCINMDLSETIEKYINISQNTKERITELLASKDLLIEFDNNKMHQFFAEFCGRSAELKEKADNLLVYCGKVQALLDEKRFDSVKYFKNAVIVNDLQKSIEEDEFYCRIIVGAIDQAIAIHKIVMEEQLLKDNDSIEKNSTRLKFIVSQCRQINEVCDFIINIINGYIMPRYTS